MRIFQHAIMAALLLASTLFVRAEDNRVGFRNVDFQNGERQFTVAVWYPTDAEGGSYRYGGVLETNQVALDAPVKANADGWPLLAWSHGYGGGGIGSVFLAEALAAEGWIVAAPDHSDRDQTVRIRTGPQKIDGREYLRRTMELAKTGRGFDRQTHAYRVEELKGTIDGVLASEHFGDRIDLEKIAAGGHSLGGYTALALHLGLVLPADERVKSILLYSPGVFMFSQEEIAEVTVPTMYWLGEAERESVRAHGENGKTADDVFEQLPAPKYFLELEGAGHFAFNNGYTEGRLSAHFRGTPAQFEVLTEYSVPFLQKYVEKKDAVVPPFRRDVVKGKVDLEENSEEAE